MQSCSALADLSPAQDEMETLMQRIDLNDNGIVEFEEFAAGMLDWRDLQVCSACLQCSESSYCAAALVAPDAVCHAAVLP